ncbi:hypothetical protein [Curtobacterium sp. MCJR17_043]|uniref:hypothetical protein n=1 Tax=Curtobacterium sp. MCJR17_043 TaxID=2175660 RepID=UPI0032E8EDD0
MTAALRESAEEAGVPEDGIDLRHTAVLDLGFWTYTTVVGRASRPFAPVVADRESLALAWVPVADVPDLPLHPGFGASWPALRATLDRTPHVVVDAANVVGSVPDGWWKDRAGAASRLVARVSALAASGVDAAALDLPSATWWPRWTVVLEGGGPGCDPGRRRRRHPSRSPRGDRRAGTGRRGRRDRRRRADRRRGRGRPGRRRDRGPRPP